MAYQALLTEGRVAEQERLLNRDLLIELWPVINLDQRVRDLWETRFPELRVRRGAGMPPSREGSLPGMGAGTVYPAGRRSDSSVRPGR